MGGAGDERKRERRLNAVVVVVTLAAIPLAFYAFTRFTADTVEAVAEPDVPDCGDFEFDGSDWDEGPRSDDRAEQSRGLAACETLSGSSRQQVMALLGRPADVRRVRGELRITFPGGRGFDATGYGSDDVLLTVRFTGGRVKATGAHGGTALADWD